MRYSEIYLVEGERQDDAIREEALATYRAIMTFLQGENNLQSYSKGFLVSLKDIGIVDDTGLGIYFCKRLRSWNGGQSPAFGFLRSSNQPVIVMPILVAHGDSSIIGLLFSDYHVKTEFLHEFAHFELWRRTGKKGSNLRANSDEDYFNHPHELDAYYKEAVSKIVDYMRNLATGNPRVLQLTTEATEEELRNRVWNEIDRKFKAALTPDNQRRIKKRIARFVRESLMPVLQRLSEER